MPVTVPALAGSFVLADASQHFLLNCGIRENGFDHLLDGSTDAQGFLDAALELVNFRDLVGRQVALSSVLVQDLLEVHTLLYETCDLLCNRIAGGQGDLFVCLCCLWCAHLV